MTKKYYKKGYSPSALQRKYKLSYIQAAELADEMDKLFKIASIHIDLVKCFNSLLDVIEEWRDKTKCLGVYIKPLEHILVLQIEMNFLLSKIHKIGVNDE